MERYLQEGVNSILYYAMEEDKSSTGGRYKAPAKDIAPMMGTDPAQQSSAWWFI